MVGCVTVDHISRTSPQCITYCCVIDPNVCYIAILVWFILTFYIAVSLGWNLALNVCTLIRESEWLKFLICMFSSSFVTFEKLICDASFEDAAYLYPCVISMATETYIVSTFCSVYFLDIFADSEENTLHGLYV